MNQTRLTGSFLADGNDGRHYRVQIWTEFIEAPASEGATVEVPGNRTLRTSQGFDVKWLAKGEYQISQTGVKLHSKDPKAP
jgi:hypothetical protein